MQVYVDTTELKMAPIVRARVERRATYHLLRHGDRLTAASVKVRPVKTQVGFFLCLIHGEFEGGRATSVRCTDLSPLDATNAALSLFDLRVQRRLEGGSTVIVPRRFGRGVFA